MNKISSKPLKSRGSFILRYIDDGIMLSNIPSTKEYAIKEYRFLKKRGISVEICKIIPLKAKTKERT